MTWCVPSRPLAPLAEKCFSLSKPAKSSRKPVVEGGRPTWVRLFAYFTRSAVLTPEMDVYVCVSACVCGGGHVVMAAAAAAATVAAVVVVVGVVVAAAVMVVVVVVVLQTHTAQFFVQDENKADRSQ